MDDSHAREVAAALSKAAVATTSLDPLVPGPHGILVFESISGELFEMLRHLQRSSQVIALAASKEYLDASVTWQLLHAGAAEVLTWNAIITPTQIRARLERWFKVEELASQALTQEGIIGESPAWLGLVRNVVEAGRYTSVPVLLTGESGTGKELLARLINTVGAEAGRELVTVDCSTIVAELSGSELFGHERGSFTGAHAQREGAFALANGATLFLDEIGELPPALQAQLLRAIQEKTYKRVGGNTWQTTSFRLICATNRDLSELTRTGHFRVDLYHRIAGWVFRTLPLRERREDILPLARYFLSTMMGGSEPPEMDEAVQCFLVGREYAGNIRELRQLVQRIAHRHVGPGPITAGDIPKDDRPAPGDAGRAWPDEQLDRSIAEAVAMGASLREINHTTAETAIRFAVQSESGNLQRAAKRLGVTDRTLQLRRAAGQL
jgi:transcriptional regulator with GAF, ATPase, and Fis domain